MAYVVGKKIGKRPVFPKVSPKKTIEGTIGGIILTVIIIFIIKKYLIKIPENVVIISLVVILFGIFGDFVESYMKRKLGIKDSGNLIPGHGGILDRMDSIYLSVLPYLILISLFR
jgi:phosphatidate cytidylyltransferase